MSEPGATRRVAEERLHLPADRARHAARLLRRRDRDAGRGRPRQPARLPGRLEGGPRGAPSRRPAAPPDEEAVHAHVRALLHLRQETRALRRGRDASTCTSADKTWVYARVARRRAPRALVALNTGDRAGDARRGGGGDRPRPTARGCATGSAPAASVAVEGGRLRLASPPALIGGIRAVGQTILLIPLLSFMSVRDD